MATTGQTFSRNARYAAFISYSRTSDADLAMALQTALPNVGRLWYQRRTMRIFRDVSVLPVSPDAWAGVARALDDSQFLIVLASPAAAASDWVNKEIDYWLKTKPADRILLVLTRGELVWDPAIGDFDPNSSTALPPALRGRFAAEPSWADLRATRTLGRRPRSQAWHTQIAPLAAALAGTTIDSLIEADERVFRRNRLTAVAAGTALVVLILASTSFAIWGARNSSLAEQQSGLAAEAEELARQRERSVAASQFALRSETLGTTDPTLAALFAAAAWRLDPGPQAERAALAALTGPARRMVALSTTAADVVRWHPEAGTVAAIGGNTTSKELVIVNVGTGELIASHSKLQEATISPDGRTVATVTASGKVVVRDAATDAVVGGVDVPGNPYVTALAISPDGRLIAVNDREREVTVWEIPTRRLLAAITRSEFLQTMTFSADGGTLVIDDGREVTTWATATGALRSAVSIDDPIWWFAVSPDGRRVATGGEVARLVDTTTGQLVILSGHGSGAVPVVAFSPDGGTLVTIGNDHRTVVHDGSTGKVRATLTGTDIAFDLTPPIPADPADPVAFSPDGRRLAIADQSGAVQVWDLVTAERSGQYSGHSGPAGAVAFSADGHTLVSSGDDQTLRIWRVAPDRPLTTLRGGPGALVGAALATPAGTVVAAGTDRTLRVWQAATGRAVSVTTAHAAAISDFAVSPDGRLAVTTSDDGTARLWDPATGAAVRTLDAGSPLGPVAFSPDSTLLATAQKGLNSLAGGPVIVWNVATGARVITIDQTHGEVREMVFSPDGRNLATASNRDTFVWDLTTGQFTSWLEGYHLPGVTEIRAIALSPDGRELVTVGGNDEAWEDPMALLWNTDDGVPLGELAAHGAAVTAVAFSPDGLLIATGSGEPGCLSCPPDYTVRLWDATTRTLVATIPAPAAVRAVAFSPDGRTLAIANDAGTVQLATVTGQIAITFTGHTGPVNSVQWSPDGAVLLTAGDDGTARLWMNPITDEFSESLCALAGRSLKPDEWAQVTPSVPAEPVC